MLFSLCTLATVALLTIIAIRWGCLSAARCSLIFALLVPTWINVYVGVSLIDVRAVALAAALFFHIFSNEAKLPLHFTLMDAVVIALTLCVGLAQYNSGDFLPTSLPSIFLIWMAPYIYGRVLSSVPNAIERVTPIMFIVAVAVFVFVAFESITHVNPINYVFGRTGSNEAESGFRWGLRRAEGISKHPIWMGMVIAALFPWVLSAGSAIRNGNWSSYFPRGAWIAIPTLIAFAILFPMSRGPILILIGTLGVTTLLMFKSIRLPLAAIAIGVVLLFVINRGVALQFLEATAQDTDAHPIVVQGEEFAYTGTSHRYLLFVVYGQAMRDAGAFGFGSFSLDRTQYLDYVEPHLRQLFSSIDNHYIVTILNYGYVGLIAFLLVGSVGAYGCWRLFLKTNAEASPNRLFYAAVFGWLISTFAMLLTVWMESDFGFLVLWNVGFVTTQWSLLGRLSSKTYCEAKPSVFPKPSPALSPNRHGSVRPHTFPLPGTSMAATNNETTRGFLSNLHENSGTPIVFDEAGRFPLRRYLLVGVVSLAVAALAAIFVGPKLATDKWVYQSRLVFHEGHVPIGSYHAPRLTEIVALVASSQTIRPAMQSDDDESVISQSLEVRAVPGSSFTNLKLKWPNREEGERILSGIVQSATESVDQLRTSRIEEVAIEIQSTQEKLSRDTHRQKQELAAFHEENETASVSEDLISARNELFSLERALLDAEAERRGIQTQVDLHKSINEEFNQMAKPADFKIKSEERHRSLKRMIDQKREQESRAIAEIMFENQKVDVERKRKLAAHQVISQAELQEAELELNLMKVKVTNAENHEDLVQELWSLEDKLADAESQAQTDYVPIIGQKIANEERIASLSERFLRFKADEARLRGLLGEEAEIESQIKILAEQQHNLDRAKNDLDAFANSALNRLTVGDPPELADPPVESNRKKMLAAIFMGVLGLLMGPIMLVDSLIAMHRRKIAKLTNIGLGKLISIKNSRYEQSIVPSKTSSNLLVAPPAEIRRMINQLSAVIDDRNFVLAFAGMDGKAPANSMMFDVARCFSRHGRRVQLTIVNSAQDASAQEACRQDQLYAREIPDSFEIECSNSVTTAVAQIDKKREQFDLVIIAAGFDATQVDELDLLSFYSDGIVVSDLGRGKHLRKRVNVVRQVNRSEGNILGLIQ